MFPLQLNADLFNQFFILTSADAHHPPLSVFALKEKSTVSVWETITLLGTTAVFSLFICPAWQSRILRKLFHGSTLPVLFLFLSAVRRNSYLLLLCSCTIMINPVFSPKNSPSTVWQVFESVPSHWAGAGKTSAAVNFEGRKRKHLH